MTWLTLWVVVYPLLRIILLTAVYQLGADKRIRRRLKSCSLSQLPAPG